MPPSPVSVYQKSAYQNILDESVFYPYLFYLIDTKTLGVLLLTWFNFNPCMGK